MKGYKVFFEDWKGLYDFQWEVGKVFEYKDEMQMGRGGFYFCLTLTECLKWRGRTQGNRKNHVTEIEVTGSVIGEDTSKFGTRYITDELKIVRELLDTEIDKILEREKEMGVKSVSF